MLAHRDGTLETAEKIQDELKATIRCLPFDMGLEEGTDPLSGKPSPRRVIKNKPPKSAFLSFYRDKRQCMDSTNLRSEGASRQIFIVNRMVSSIFLAKSIFIS